MTKGELLECLKPFEDEVEISIAGPLGIVALGHVTMKLDVITGIGSIVLEGKHE